MGLKLRPDYQLQIIPNNPWFQSVWFLIFIKIFFLQEVMDEMEDDEEEEGEEEEEADEDEGAEKKKVVPAAEKNGADKKPAPSAAAVPVIFVSLDSEEFFFRVW